MDVTTKPMFKVLRGRVLSFTRRPETVDDDASYTYLQDGGVAIDGAGRIVGVGEFAEIAKSHPGEVIDHRPNLIMPGLIDPHIHFVQMQVVGSYAASLLEWLNTYTFVEEQRFADAAHAAHIASAFFDELIRQGTTTAAAYCSVHGQSVDAFFEAAAQRNMAMIAGKCMMDRNCPTPLQDTPQTGYDDSKRLLEKWQGTGRAHYAITPRFAITSSMEQMEMMGALASEFPDSHIQTHLSENDAEIAFTMELFPGHRDYVDVYASHGLMRPKALYGHAIHLSDREVGVMAETGATAVSCPTSNLFLGSGLYDLDRMQSAGVRSAVATDIGGGTSYSMLQTLDEFYKVQQMCGNRLPPLASFYMVTLGNAIAIGLEQDIGQIAPGKMADIVVLDARATPAMALRMERVETLSEELFVLQTMGDDRAIAETYVAGQAMKSALG